MDNLNKIYGLEAEARLVIESLGLMAKYRHSPSLDPFRNEYIYMYPPPTILSPCDWRVPYGNHPLPASNNTKDKEIGLYVHIPYCRHICKFCHYVRFLEVSKDKRQEYLEALKKEILLLDEKVGLKRYSVTQVHFGGGTPTCLDDNELEDILSFINKQFFISESAEITFETSPETLTLTKAKCLQRLNVNRLSLGIQSFDENVLAKAGRGHTASEAFKAYETARSAGFQNINIDLLYGLPFQTLDSWDLTLQKVISLEPEHITCFNLRIKPETFFGPSDNLKNLPKKEEVLLMRTMAFLMFQQVNYVQTVGNCWAVSKRFVYRHQDHKYSMGEYLGIGVAAHSYFNGCAYFNERNLKNYLNRIKNNKLPIYLGHRLTSDQKMSRAMVLGFKRGYVNKRLFERLFGESIDRVFPQEIGRLFERKMIDDNSASIRVKFEGMLFINEVCESFFTEEDGAILNRASSSGAYGSYLS